MQESLKTSILKEAVKIFYSEKERNLPQYMFLHKIVEKCYVGCLWGEKKIGR